MMLDVTKQCPLISTRAFASSPDSFTTDTSSNSFSTISSGFSSSSLKLPPNVYPLPGMGIPEVASGQQSVFSTLAKRGFYHLQHIVVYSCNFFGELSVREYTISLP